MQNTFHPNQRRCCIVRAIALTIVLLAVNPMISFGQSVSDEIKLWPSTPPGRIAAKGEERDTSNETSNKVAGRSVIRLGNVSTPTLKIFSPANPSSKAAVLVCPGGGYNILALDLEGTEVCQWLNSMGVTAGLLKYRVPKADGDPTPIEALQDAQRAMSILRSKASELDISSDKIGVLGFSAGGHLSARLSTNDRAYSVTDDIDKIGCNPNFAVLIYPAYLYDKATGNASPQLPVTGSTPPMFMTMAFDDAVDVNNVLRFSLAMKQAKVPFELHVYPNGGHGYGLRESDSSATTWPARAAEWMQKSGFISAPERKSSEMNKKVSDVSSDEDPYLWLEDVTGDKALGWVREQNEKSLKKIESDPKFTSLRDDLVAILDSDERIPMVVKHGEFYYNFWRDKKNERGLWRRTTLDEYRKPQPKWEILLDLDELAKAEKENWVWDSAEMLRPDYDRALIDLSRGGADASVTREFDLKSRKFVEDGFQRTEAKGGMDWIDRDHTFVYTNFGDGTTTDSGYPRIVKLWERGTPIESAKLVYEGKQDDMYIAAYHDDTPGYERNFVRRTIAFYNNEVYLRKDDGQLIKIDVPNSAEKSAYRKHLYLKLREPWEVAGKKYAAGSLLIADFQKFLDGDREFAVVYEPDDHSSLSSYQPTQEHLLLNILEDVKNRVYVVTEEGGKWKRKPLEGAPQFGTINVTAVDPDESNAYFMTSTDFITPTTLYYGEIGGQPEQLKQLPSFFDSTGLKITQHFATSKDGTKVPYFMVAKEGLKLDGNNPTLLYGYGGFEISLTPNYSGSVGRAWTSQGGVYVVANIRGGGEYGPRWHQSALKKNRLRAYEDFAAVGEDLISRKVTSSTKLGIQGGSNGGLLVGNMVALYPNLFTAAVCQVPLLDMKRYHLLLAGASWMAEYGNPDAGDWEFIQTYSPYQNIHKATKYPAVLFLTSTRDDRVHPGHARKMMAKMLGQGHDVTYYENIEGGHGGAANNKQLAFMQAVAYTFMRERLFGK